MKAAMLWAALAAFGAAGAYERPLRTFDGDTEPEVKEAQEELADLQKRIDRGDIPKIQFDINSAALRPQSEEVLDRVADLMTRNPRLKLMVFAYTCNTGSAAYNLRLSQARALSVKTALTRRGVPPPSIRYRGRGLEEPIADNRTEEGREQNRRVEFHLMKRWWSSIY